MLPQWRHLSTWILIFCLIVSEISSSVLDCGYHLDGIDDSLSFTIYNNFNKRFTLMFWFKNHWKDKNSHIPQTIYSQGHQSPNQLSHDHQMRIMWSPESKLLIELQSERILCSLDLIFHHERFYHFALSGGHNSTMKVYVNGLDVNPICFRDVGKITESRVVVDKHSQVKILNNIPIYLGSSSPIWGNADDNYFKGTITDFRIYTKVLSSSQIYTAMFHSSDTPQDPGKYLFMDQKLRSDCDKEDSLDPEQASSSLLSTPNAPAAAIDFRRSRTLHKILPPPHTGASSAMIHISGSPLVAQLNHGEGYLSVMLSVIETKLALSVAKQTEGILCSFRLISLSPLLHYFLGEIVNTFSEVLGPLSSIVIDDLVGFLPTLNSPNPLSLSFLVLSLMSS
jgi:hypothetical protein